MTRNLIPQKPGTTGSRSKDLVVIDLIDHMQNLFPSIQASANYVISLATYEYLRRVDLTAIPAPMLLEQELMAATNAVIRNENTKAPSSAERIPLLSALSSWQIAQILLHLHHVIRIAPNAKSTDREYDVLAMYVDRGPSRGTYTASEDDIRTQARLYNTALTLAAFKEILAVLAEDSPRLHECEHRDLIAVRNGIVYYGTQDIDLTIGGHDFHFKAKDVHPFHPALVFLTKAHIDYVENPPPVMITHPDDQSVWEVRQWVDDLFYTEGDLEFNERNLGMADLIWEIIGATLRPHVNWGKTAWFFSEKGNNGKGTLCALLRNLIGPDAHTSIPLSDFGKDFALEPLVRANAIIVDENDVGTFIDKAANLKAVVTHDVIQINRKYRTPIAYQFFGFMIQCLNEFPRIKDKSDSFYRRQLFVPFTKSFTGAERKYIKDDYLQRREVLEYVLWYAINHAGTASPGSYYQLSEPLATRMVLSDYKEFNDPVRMFWDEIKPELVWDLQPFTFLYDLYKSWFCQASPSGSPVSRQQFVGDIIAIIDNDPQWTCPDKNRKIRPGTMMDLPEPLIVTYELKNWYSPTYTGNDPLRLSRPLIHPNYRGILRTNLAATQSMLQHASAAGTTGDDQSDTAPEPDQA